MRTNEHFFEKTFNKNKVFIKIQKKINLGHIQEVLKMEKNLEKELSLLIMAVNTLANTKMIMSILLLMTMALNTLVNSKMNLINF